MRLWIFNSNAARAVSLAPGAPMIDHGLRRAIGALMQ
jgi:hypothetical protein